MSGSAPTVLAVSGLNVAVSGADVLRDVSFELREGEFAGLIGANGSGKTTLFKALLGLIGVRSGEIDRCGRPRSAFGYVPQKVAIDSSTPLRVRDLVALGVDGHRFGWRRHPKEVRARVDAVLAELGAGPIADRRVGELSGGQQQRALIAHALAADPAVLLLDEPLANLDPGAVQDVVSLLDGVVRQRGVAVVMAAHDMNPLMPYIDRVIYVANGRVASGPTDDVVRPEILSGLYGHHVDVLRVHGRVLVVGGEGDEADDEPDHPAVVVE
ncbi:MAG TPA: metal ABC transporter ATP-binding protein [Acidimicrobiales bacterium]|nr:metal ABC transporter ATP-binding protein [Acidimicrobiales bacterium]